MGLEQELADFNAKLEVSAPPGAAPFLNTKTEELESSFAFDRVPKPGDLAPEFLLPDMTCNTISLHEKLARGQAVLTFYRGAWCPYRNIQLPADEHALPAIAEAGSCLIAISPQRPDGSLSTTETDSLTFDVLSDAGNMASRKFGLVNTLPKDLNSAYSTFGVDLTAINGDDSWELPKPATFVIGRSGRIAHAEADYRRS